MGSWADFFTAELGAAAALAGLVIVGISINVTRILADPALPGRAVETLVLPTGILVASTYALVPHQPDWLLGTELAVTGAVMWIIPAIIHVRAFRMPVSAPVRWVPRLLLAFFASWPFIASGILLVLHVNGALYWAVSGVVVALIATVINAWVLLVEILR
jgi:modulator of FtsH protease